MNILKFEDYKTVNDFIIANEGGRDEEEYKTIVYKSGNKFGAITTREVFGEEVLDISELLTSLYDTPETIKELFSLGDLYLLGVNIPDEQYIRDVEKTLKDGYVVLDDFDFIAQVPPRPYKYNDIHKVIEILRDKFCADNMTLSEVILNRLLGKTVTPQIHTSQDLKELYKGEMYLFDNKSKCWYIERRSFDQNGRSILKGFKKAKKANHYIGEIESKVLECTMFELCDSDLWIMLPTEGEEQENIDTIRKDYKYSDESLFIALNAYMYFNKHVKGRYNQNAHTQHIQKVTPRMIVMQVNKEALGDRFIFRNYRMGYSTEHQGNNTYTIFKVWDNPNRRGNPIVASIDPMDIIYKFYRQNTRAVDLIRAYCCQN